MTPGEQPEIVLRRGVGLPDWRVVSTPAARAALADNFIATKKAARFSGLAATTDVVWRRLLRLHVALGRMPDSAEIAESAGLPHAVVDAVLDDLAARDIIVRDQAGEIAGAYPFSRAATGHVVSVGGRLLQAMCALDALGAGAMIRRATSIASSCRHCGAVIRVDTGRRGRAIARSVPASPVVWASTAYHGSAASSLCRAVGFFCDDGHLTAWREAAGTVPRGRDLSLGEALQVARAIFEPFLAGEA